VGQKQTFSRLSDFCFTPESGHWLSMSGWLLGAKSRHWNHFKSKHGAATEILNEPETRRKKAAKAALVFEDWNGPTSSKRTIPMTRLKHIEAVETP